MDVHWQLLTLWGRSGITYYASASRIFALREPCAPSLWSLWKDGLVRGQDPLFAPQRDEHQGHSSISWWDAKAWYCEPGMCTGIWESIRSVTTALGDSPWRCGAKEQTVLLAVPSFPVETFRWCLGCVSAWITMSAVWGTDLIAQRHVKLLGWIILWRYLWLQVQ